MIVAVILFFLPLNICFLLFSTVVLRVTLLKPDLEVKCLQLLPLILLCAFPFPLSARLDLLLLLFLLPPGLLVLIVHIVTEIPDVSIFFLLFVFCQGLFVILTL